MRLLPAILIAVAVVVAPVLWVGLNYLLSEEDFQGSAVDSGARIEIEMMRQQIEDLQGRVETLRTEIARMPVAGVQVPSAQEDFRPTGPNEILNAYAATVLIADRLNVNKGLRVANGALLDEMVGRPRPDLNDDCQPPTNDKFRSQLVTESVGPIRVTMMRPAAESLKRVFENVRRADPDLYARIASSGSLCIRRIRGSVASPSTHSYGLAVDLNIDGVLDNFTDGKTQLGLTILADFFREEGWVWGAGFRREDSMHFEVSRKKLNEWIANGEL
ncbi:MAG: M15 family metallopeptidase [Sedimentitalea sp.]